MERNNDICIPHATTTNVCVSRLTELPRHTHHKSYSCNGAKHTKSNTMRQRLWLLRRWRRRDADDPDDDAASLLLPPTTLLLAITTTTAPTTAPPKARLKAEA